MFPGRICDNAVSVLDPDPSDHNVALADRDDPELADGRAQFHFGNDSWLCVGFGVRRFYFLYPN
jgi:hypothetical protein